MISQAACLSRFMRTLTVAHTDCDAARCMASAMDSQRSRFDRAFLEDGGNSKIASANGIPAT